MKIPRVVLIATLAFGGACLASAAWADTKISVKLTGEAHEKMGAELSQSTVPAGPVEFDVTNAAAKTGHEMIIIKLKAKDEKLAVDPATGRVNEKALQSLGEVSKLKPGMGGKLTADLKPGDYLVFCNYKGHYEAGMEAPLTVTPLSVAPASSGGLPPPSVGAGTRILHWLSAALIVAAFGLAWSFNALSPGSTAGRLVDVHRTVGLTILALTALRLVWRAAHPLPSLPRGPAWEAWLARGVQAALYAALLAQPLLGWAASSAQGDTVTYLGVLTLPDIVETDQDRADAIFRLHKLIGFTILGLATLHVAGALRHGLVKRDGVLRRMVTGRPVEVE